MESTQRWLRHSGVTEVLLQSLAEGTHGSDTQGAGSHLCSPKASYPLWGGRT